VRSAHQPSTLNRQPGACLLIKTWSTNGLSLDDIRVQANALLCDRVGKPLSAFQNILFWEEWVSELQMPRLYRAVDAYVTPTRGEGWCRPLMAAMATGLPTIATGWSGLTDFHDAKVGYPLKYQLAPVSEAGASEIPIFAGHRWAEPDVDDLRRLLRRVVERPEEALRKGRAARERIASRFSRPAVTARLREEIAHCRALAASRAVPSSGVRVPSSCGRTTKDEGGTSGDDCAPAGQPHPPDPSICNFHFGCLREAEAADNLQSPILRWVDAPPFGRRTALLRALRALHAMRPGPATIVETGTIRDGRPQACQSDGWSTLAWGWYAAETGGRAFTVDVSAEALALCRRITAEYAASIEFVQADSVAFLRDWSRERPGSIDLLYLDSLDYFDPEASEAHALAEAEAAMGALSPACLVLFDDTHPAGPAANGGLPPLRGKGARAVPYLLAQGFERASLADGQALLVREAERDSIGGVHSRMEEVT
jgi:hypothetical protein